MADRAYLVLEDGSIFPGEAFGARLPATGEVVFNTSMTGYQEALTDPSYAGQMLVMTYPIQGNYGVNAADDESSRVQVSAFVVREHARSPSHRLMTATLDEYLTERGVPAISGVDTRALTRRLRMAGVMMGALVQDEAPEAALRRLQDSPRYGAVDLVPTVSTDVPFTWPPAGAYAPPVAEAPRHRVVVLDLGVKYNIMRSLRRFGCEVTAVPARSTAETILELKPDGVVLSPGPGDPALLDYVVQTTKGLIGRVPVMGICLGHQVTGIAMGGRTYKLPFGHRGANHPVKELATGRVHITAQNHGYAVDGDGLPGAIEVSHLHLNDGTVEGLRGRNEPLLTIQYHSEASPGPLDNMYLFERFVEMMVSIKGGANGAQR
ncbi:MAG TPA: glutamine-hydrolyzing carbamoyl-phosphate synthase small subunit [Dehalococcoidia bacterium]|nr:glutamine-hydrolyzing carbamoyl-phosphate synthase small subunit [Dehalococcoidia bacterium]